MTIASPCLRTCVSALMLVGILLAPAAGAHGQGNRPSIGITNLEAQYEVDPGLAALVSDQLFEHARRSGAFSRVSSRMELEMEMGPAAAQLSTCTESCLVELAGGLKQPVDYILRGSLAKIGQSFIMTLHVISIAKGATVASVSERLRGESEEVILDAVAPALASLLQQMGLGGTATPAPAAAADDADARMRAEERELAERAERERAERERLERELAREKAAREAARKQAERERVERERAERELAEREAARRERSVPVQGDDVSTSDDSPGMGRRFMSTGCTVGTAGVVGLPIVISPFVMLAGFALGLWGFIQWVQEPGFLNTPFVITAAGIGTFVVGLAMFLVPVFVIAPVAGKMLNSLGLMNEGVANAINGGVRTISFGVVRGCL